MATTPRVTGKTLDTSFGLEGGRTVYTRTARIGGNTVRVTVSRDFYQHQSRAWAEVLTPELTWTTLATAPAEEWHGKTDSYRNGRKPFVTPYERAAEELHKRAKKILG